MKLTRKLGRSPSRRNHMIRNLLSCLVIEEQITTTTARAKEIRRHADKIVKVAKKGGIANYRFVNDLLRQKEATKKLFDVLATRYKDHPGTFCRLIKAGQRKDGSQLSVIEYLQPGYKKVQQTKKVPVPPAWYTRALNLDSQSVPTEK